MVVSSFVVGREDKGELSGGELFDDGNCIGTVGKEEEEDVIMSEAVGNEIDGVWGVVGGAAGICGDVKFGEAMIVGGDDSES